MRPSIVWSWLLIDVFLYYLICNIYYTLLFLGIYIVIAAFIWLLFSVTRIRLLTVVVLNFVGNIVFYCHLVSEYIKGIFMPSLVVFVHCYKPGVSVLFAITLDRSPHCWSQVTNDRSSFWKVPNQLHAYKGFTALVNFSLQLGFLWLKYHLEVSIF